MFTRPTTEQVLDLYANELRDTVLPELPAGPVHVLVEQMDQLVRSCARRAAHEIAWMHEEVAAIASATGEELGSPDSLHLDDVVAWYDRASQGLSAAVDEAFAADDRTRISELKALLDDRSATEMQIVGALDLVGRG